MSYKLDTEAEVLNYSLTLDSLSTDAPRSLWSCALQMRSQVQWSPFHQFPQWVLGAEIKHQPTVLKHVPPSSNETPSHSTVRMHAWGMTVSYNIPQSKTKSSIQLWFGEVGFWNALSLGGQRNSSSSPWLTLLFHVDFMFKVLSHILALQECKV